MVLLQQLVAGLDAPPARGTVAAAILNDAAMYGGWLLRRMAELQRQNPGDDSKVMEEIHELLVPRKYEPLEGDLWEQLTKTAGGTSEAVFRLFQDRLRMYEKAAVVLALPYPE